MDDLQTTIDGVCTGAIGAHRVRSHHEEGIHVSNLPTAVGRATYLLADNEWHEMRKIESIARDYGVRVEAILREGGIGESESGEWVCLAYGNCSEAAPDE